MTLKRTLIAFFLFQSLNTVSNELILISKQKKEFKTSMIAAFESKILKEYYEKNQKNIIVTNINTDILGIIINVLEFIAEKKLTLKTEDLYEQIQKNILEKHINEINFNKFYLILLSLNCEILTKAIANLYAKKIRDSEFNFLNCSQIKENAKKLYLNQLLPIANQYYLLYQENLYFDDEKIDKLLKNYLNNRS